MKGLIPRRIGTKEEHQVDLWKTLVQFQLSTPNLHLGTDRRVRPNWSSGDCKALVRNMSLRVD